MNLVGIRKNPIPRGSICDMLECGPKVKLRYARWKPTTQRAKGTVCLFHGRNEFIEKYFEVIGELRKRGFAVATMDWRGQGSSTRMGGLSSAGHVDDFSEYDADMRVFMREVVLPDCPPPYYALAHSMGAAVLINAACETGGPFDRIVASSPMISLHAGQTPRGLLGGIAGAASFFGLGSLPIGSFFDTHTARDVASSHRLSSDVARIERNLAIVDKAPELTSGPPTIGWLHAASRIMRRLSDPDFAERVHVPVLLTIGTLDTVVSVQAAELMGRGLKNGGLVLVPGGKHELMMDLDRVRDRFWGAFDAFVPGTRVYSPFEEPIL